MEWNFFIISFHASRCLGLMECDFNDCLFCSANWLAFPRIYLFPSHVKCFLLLNVCSFLLSLPIREYCKTWYHLLVAKLLYCNPAIKSFDLQYHTQVNMYYIIILLKGQGHTVSGNFSTDQLVIELTETSQ